MVSAGVLGLPAEALQLTVEELGGKGLLPWVCGLPGKKAVDPVHADSVPPWAVGLWVAEHGADTERCLRASWPPCPSMRWMSTALSPFHGALELVGHH